MENTTLIAPNSLPIVGMKMIDGSVATFKYSRDPKTAVSIFALDPKLHTSWAKPTRLVDSEGNEWDALDVEFHTALHGPK